MSYFSSVAVGSVGFSDIFIVRLVFFVSFLGDAKKKKNINVIETSTNLMTSNYFSIQFSIENHLPSKGRRQARSDSLKWQASQCKENGLLFMEVRKQKSGEERIKEQSASETVCFAWRNRFCSFQRHKNKPRFFWFVFSSMEKMNEGINFL